MGETGVARSYRAETLQEQQAAYDSWAKQYEIDLCTMGYRLPAMIAAVARVAKCVLGKAEGKRVKTDPSWFEQEPSRCLLD